jgi:transcription initiation factor IIE alpha subunit
MNPSRLVEELIASVARAFYDDLTVTIMDALVQEKFIREEELGPRLKLPNDKVKSVVTQLEREQLVSFEDLTMDDLRTSKCWYIDYRRFMHMAHYRLYLMQKEIQDRERQQCSRLFFECPTCRMKQSDLEAMRLMGKDNRSFICPHCCPSRNIRDCEPEPYFTLVEYNNKNELVELNVLKQKIGSQLSEVPRFHAGLFDILAQLKEIPPEEIIRNKPSDNIKRGNINTRVTDADILKEIEENNKRIRGKARKQIPGMEKEEDFSIEIAGADGVGEGENGNGEPAAKKHKPLPFFVDGSRVYGRDSNGAPQATSGSSAAAAAGAAASVVDIPVSASNRSATGALDSSAQYRFGYSSSTTEEPATDTHITTASGSVSVVSSAPAKVVIAAVDTSNKAPTAQQAEEDLQDLADIEWEE